MFSELLEDVVLDFGQWQELRAQQERYPSVDCYFVELYPMLWWCTEQQGCRRLVVDRQKRLSKNNENVEKFSKESKFCISARENDTTEHLIPFDAPEIEQQPKP